MGAPATGASDPVERREDILEAIAFAADRFLRGDSLDEALRDVLARLGQAAAASRVVLTERVTRANGSYMRPRAEWDASGVRPLALTDQDGFAYFPRWETELGAGRLVSGRIAEFPESEQGPLAADSVGSIVVMPVTAGDAWWGHVGFDDARLDRVWTGPEIEALRAAAGMIGAAIRHAAAASAIARRNAIIESVAAAIPLLVATDRWMAVLPEVLQSLQGVMAARAAWAYRIPPDGTARLVAEVVADGEGRASAFGQSVRLTPERLADLGAGRALQNVTFTSSPDEELAATQSLGMRSWVVVPIIASGVLWGGVGIDSHDERMWDEGEVVALQVAAAAISATMEREASANQVRRLEKMDAVGRLAGGLAHDFGNLLGIVLGHAELIRDDATDPELRADAETILDAAVRGRDLVRDLLTFSRPRGGNVAPTDLGALVNRIVRILRAAVGSGTEIVLRIEPGLPPVLTDPAELEHVLVNLVVNARDAMPNGGRVTIAATMAPPDSLDEQAADAVVLSIADTGTGMDEATKERIFEPFFSTKAEGVGTGLGLATAYGSVAAWGGSIEVDTELGTGTTFRLRLSPAPAA